MTMLDKITTGPVRRPRRTLIYGTHGIGKSTFGAMAERRSSSRPRTASRHRRRAVPDRRTSSGRHRALGALYTEEHEYQTVVVDSSTGSSG
jgi:hypothetical protein